MATVTFTDTGAPIPEWVVPDRVHSIRVKLRSGGGAAPQIGGMGGHYLEVTADVVPGETIQVAAGGPVMADSANTEGANAQLLFEDGRRVILLGGYTYTVAASPESQAATATDPDPHGGFPYVIITGAGGRTTFATSMLWASDQLFYRGGLGVTGGGGGSGANSTGPGVDASGSTGGASGGDGGGGGDVGQDGDFPGGASGSSDPGDEVFGAGATLTIEYFETSVEDGHVYFGRIQQGRELVLSLQCGDEYGTPEDPASLPWVQVYIDGETPALITSTQMPSEARRVEDGIFRLSLFLDTLYSTEGRYLVVMKWLDSNGVAHVRTGSFHLLPGGGADGAVISMCSMIRQGATYMLMQCDSGRLIRKRNPR